MSFGYFPNKDQLESYLLSARTSKKVILFIIFYTFFLDYVLLTAIVPVIPDYLFGIDMRDAEMSSMFHNASTNTTANPRINQQSNIGSGQMIGAVQPSLNINNENDKVGWLLSSKAIMQLIANPFVGPIANRFGYSVLVFCGTCLLMTSTLVYAFGETYWVLLIARCIQGVGSACTIIAGMSMIAEKYPDDKDRSKAMGIAMGGSALGVLVGYPMAGFFYSFVGKASPFIAIGFFVLIDIGLQAAILQPTARMKTESAGTPIKKLLMDPYIVIGAGALMFTTMSMAILESTIPIWLLDTMGAAKWQLGMVFLPDGIGYLIGTNVFGIVAGKLGRWICAISALLLIGICLVCITFGTRIPHLILPQFGLGISVGIIDASIMPLLALLVDTRHVPAYGSVYVIAQVAICLAYATGPSIGGVLVEHIGFQWLMRGMAVVNISYAPLCYYLRKPRKSEETTAIVSNELNNDTCSKETGYSNFDYQALE